MMGNAGFSDDFKREAVLEMTERGDPMAKVSRRPESARIPVKSGARCSRGDDLMDWGGSCWPNRVARLAQRAGERSRIGYQTRPGNHGGNHGGKHARNGVPSPVEFERQHKTKAEDVWKTPGAIEALEMEAAE
jgi:hypothetical protein